jgi:hypothetical protein
LPLLHPRDEGLKGVSPDVESLSSSAYNPGHAPADNRHSNLNGEVATIHNCGGRTLRQKGNITSMRLRNKVGIALGSLGLVGVLGAAPAFAAPTTTNVTTSGHSATGGNQGKGAQVNHYTANYADPVFGQVSCTGVNQVKSGSMQDSFTCTSTPAGASLQNVTPNEQITLPGGGGQGTIPGWISDFDGSSYAKTFSATVSSTGTSYTAVATY